MFFVIDKSKIFSYVIAICTVVILFVATTGLNNINAKQNTTTTSSNILEENTANITKRNSNNILNENSMNILVGNNLID